MAGCNQSALDGALMLERMENEDARGICKLTPKAISTGTLDRDQIRSRLRKLLEPRVRSALRGMINHLLPIEVEVE